jgi:hypothetical protein
LRRQATSVRNYLSQLYKGPRDTQEFYDLWTLAEMVDTSLDNAYRHGGKPAVDWVLLNDDNTEHSMSRIGAQVAFLRSGDRRVYDAIVTSKPPGESDLLPSWALQEAREHSTQLWKQEKRVEEKPSRTSPVVPPGAAVTPKGKAKGGLRKRGKFTEGGDAAAPSK